MTRRSEPIDVTQIPIVDAHHHFWDLQRNYYPWLCDSRLIPFRYGDYGAIRRNYLPPDYLRESAKYRVVKTVHMDRGDIAEVLANHAKSPLVRGIRHKPKAAPDPQEATRGAAALRLFL
jgi:predicted TIM-barrel fold metal-dependent hydrolase